MGDNRQPEKMDNGVYFLKVHFAREVELCKGISPEKANFMKLY